jgi:hypothetical protein
VGMERTATAKIENDGKLFLHVEEIHDEDMDAPKVEFSKEEYWFELKNGLFSMVKEEKQKPKMIKRK